MEHIVFKKSNEPLVNYLDDYYFVSMLTIVCNNLVQLFLDTCSQIKFLVSLEKTFWASTKMVFLGMLLDSEMQTVSIPIEKIGKARKLLQEALDKKNHKIKLQELQRICGLLNFLCRCVVLGRAFTRRLYPAGTDKLKAHHHLKLSEEMRLDLATWLKFLDFENTLIVDEVNFYTDASSTGLKDSKTGEWLFFVTTLVFAIW